MCPASFAALSIAGVQWGWFLAAAIGVFTGLAAHRSRDDAGGGMGCLGSIAVGVLGAVVGELILDRLFNVRITDLVGVALCAFIGASILVMLFGIRPRRG
jgi:uncharacterized membrane protein YeaQ/YmgE (transglycosylase-associated protein family)